MNKIASMVAGVALALSAATTASAASTLQERGEARLAKMLEGRVAGEPESCITTFRSNKLKVIERVGLVYDSGDTIWVSRPSNPEALGPQDVVVFDRFGSQLCRQDVVRTVDRYVGHITGSVFMGDFVPYTRRG